MWYDIETKEEAVKAIILGAILYVASIIGLMYLFHIVASYW